MKSLTDFTRQYTRLDKEAEEALRMRHTDAGQTQINTAITEQDSGGRKHPNTYR
jgi:hypothetical protein